MIVITEPLYWMIYYELGNVLRPSLSLSYLILYQPYFISAVILFLQIRKLRLRVVR